MSTISQNLDISLPTGLVFVLGGYIILSLAYFVVRGFRAVSLNTASTKTGFLNKPLLQFVAVFMMAIAAVGGVYMVNQSDTRLISQADKSYTVTIDYETTLVTSNRAQMVFIAGAEQKIEGEYDIVWTFRNSDGQILNYSETSLNTTSPSRLDVGLEKDVYTVSALLITDVGSFNKSIEVDLRAQ